MKCCHDEVFPLKKFDYPEFSGRRIILSEIFIKNSCYWEFSGKTLGYWELSIGDCQTKSKIFG